MHDDGICTVAIDCAVLSVTKLNTFISYTVALSYDYFFGVNLPFLRLLCHCVKIKYEM